MITRACQVTFVDKGLTRACQLTFPHLREPDQQDRFTCRASPAALLLEVRKIMSAEQERSLLARAEELADLDDLNDLIITTIGMARAARVDQEALQGLTTAVRALDGDVTALFRAATGRGRPSEFTRDTELLETVEEIEDDLSQRIRALRQLRTQIHEALDRARADDAAGRRDLAAAKAMFTTYPCKGCHPHRDAAIAAAQGKIDDAQIRLQVLNAAVELLLSLKLQDALDGVRRVPEDLHQVYETVYDLVAQDPQAMPKSGDWITGEVTAAGMAAGLLAARAPMTASVRKPR
jgi:hypothetical protein